MGKETKQTKRIENKKKLFGATNFVRELQGKDCFRYVDRNVMETWITTNKQNNQQDVGLRFGQLVLKMGYQVIINETILDTITHPHDRTHRVRFDTIRRA